MEDDTYYNWNKSPINKDGSYNGRATKKKNRL